MKVVATVIGPLKKHVGKYSVHITTAIVINSGKDVLITELDTEGGEDVPIEPQVTAYNERLMLTVLCSDFLYL